MHTPNPVIRTPHHGQQRHRGGADRRTGAERMNCRERRLEFILGFTRLGSLHGGFDSKDAKSSRTARGPDTFVAFVPLLWCKLVEAYAKRRGNG